MGTDPLATLAQALPAEGASLSAGRDMPILQLAPERLLEVVRLLKLQHGFDMLSDLTAIDWLGQTPRFEVVWHLYGTDHHRRLRIKTRVSEADATVDSLVGIHGAARFMERECHDMYGIRFRGNEDLRPILLYEGFEGHPLRKDYPIDREQPLVALRE
jgi:NADH-quinone oxidoreductase subunit C